MYGRTFRLVKEGIPGLHKGVRWLASDMPPNPASFITEVAECEIRDGYKINPETGEIDASEPCTIVHVTNINAAEIPAAQREHARFYILQAGDMFSSRPLFAAVEDNVYVCFKDERDGNYFWT